MIRNPRRPGHTPLPAQLELEAMSQRMFTKARAPPDEEGEVFVESTVSRGMCLWKPIDVENVPDSVFESVCPRYGKASMRLKSLRALLHCADEKDILGRKAARSDVNKAQNNVRTAKREAQDLLLRNVARELLRESKQVQSELDAARKHAKKAAQEIRTLKRNARETTTRYLTRLHAKLKKTMLCGGALNRTGLLSVLELAVAFEHPRFTGRTSNKYQRKM